MLLCEYVFDGQRCLCLIATAQPLKRYTCSSLSSPILLTALSVYQIHVHKAPIAAPQVSIAVEPAHGESVFLSNDPFKHMMDAQIPKTPPSGQPIGSVKHERYSEFGRRNSLSVGSIHPLSRGRCSCGGAKLMDSSEGRNPDTISAPGTSIPGRHRLPPTWTVSIVCMILSILIEKLLNGAR